MDQQNGASSGAQIDQIAQGFEEHIKVTAVGLANVHGNLPPALMLAGLAAAMGRVLSGLTQSGDMAATIRTRSMLADIVTTNTKRAYPALVPANINFDLSAPPAA
jgi:hypothetical protein